MKPSQLHALLLRTIKHSCPVMITGSPGIGKTDVVMRAAAEAGADVILSHPAVSDPTDVKGLPWVGADQAHATFLPFGDLARAIRATSPTVWFFDDLGQAPPAVQASVMQLLLARRVNEHVIPDVVTFVAATNRRSDRAGVTGILEPVKSRFGTIVELSVDLEEWTEWAMKHAIPPEMIAFLRTRTDLLSKFDPTADMTNSPSPRTWANAARLISFELPAAVEREALKGAVGEGAAVEFYAFLTMYREMPSIDAILRDPMKPALPSEPSQLYAVVTGLGARATEETFPAIGKYAIRLAEHGLGEYGALLCRDCIRRDTTLYKTDTFKTIARSDIARMVMGEALE